MNLEISLSEEVPSEAAAVGHLVFEGLVPAADGLEIDAAVCGLRSFSGKPGEALVESGAEHVRVLVGAGGRGGFSAKGMRHAAATFARAVAGAGTACLDLTPPFQGLTAAQVVQAAVEGIAGATYRFTPYRSESEPTKLESVVLVVDGTDERRARDGLSRGIATAEAVALARDLGNTPPTDMTPSRMAEVALASAGAAGVDITVHDEEWMRDERLGGLLGVARGSEEPPRLIKLSYTPEGADESVPTVALVGKGITFDSGGLSLKSGDGMMTMKDDMSGAGAVIATLGACRAAGVKVKVIGFALCTENMPSGTATKPGDVLTIRNGKTIEVLNTDAEGRLVLADGLSLAAETDADAIIDVATLTGACVVALGSGVAGMMSNDSRLVAAISSAADAAGEAVWQLPLPQNYKKFYESDIADMKNIGRPGNAGALVAGLILEEFVGERPWAHLDIAGTAYSEEDSFDKRKGCTGFIVRTLIELLSNYEAIGGNADLQADGSIR